MTPKTLSSFVNATETSIIPTEQESPLVEPREFNPPSLEDIREVLNFNDLRVVSQFFATSGWNPIMELQLLVDIIRDPLNPTPTRLRALKDLDQRRDKLLEMSGLLVKAQKTSPTADGGQTILSTNIVAAALGNIKKVSDKESRESHIPKNVKSRSIPDGPDGSTKAEHTGPRPDGPDAGSVPTEDAPCKPKRKASAKKRTSAKRPKTKKPKPAPAKGSTGGEGTGTSIGDHRPPEHGATGGICGTTGGPRAGSNNR